MKHTIYTLTVRNPALLKNNPQATPKRFSIDAPVIIPSFTVLPT